MPLCGVTIVGSVGLNIVLCILDNKYNLTCWFVSFWVFVLIHHFCSSHPSSIWSKKSYSDECYWSASCLVPILSCYNVDSFVGHRFRNVISMIVSRPLTFIESPQESFYVRIVHRWHVQICLHLKAFISYLKTALYRLESHTRLLMNFLCCHKASPQSQKWLVRRFVQLSVEIDSCVSIMGLRVYRK